MFAKTLETVLANLCQKSDISGLHPNDVANRFDTLRRYGQLTRGRENRSKHLTLGEIAAAILGLATVNPKWAGHAAIVLSKLRTVGGPVAGYFGTDRLQESITHILSDATALVRIKNLCVSMAEVGTNCHGYATLTYEIDGASRQVFYVPDTAISLLQRGAEVGFNSDVRNSPISKETVFSRTFFEHVKSAIKRANAFPKEPPGDGSEYDAEEAQQRLYRRLGVKRGSQFLSVGVDNQVTWPKEETLASFGRYSLVLMPKTRDHIQSIHVDLVSNRLDSRDAKTVINRFLSIMTWCDDQFAIAQDGWSGSPVPTAVPKPNLAFTTAHEWIFDRQIPSLEISQRALALYREGRNAQQNFFVSHAVLSFFRIIELKNPSRGDVKNWIRDNFEIVKQDSNYGDAFSSFSTICGDEKPHEYIYKSCRIAVAHANKDSESDPDDENELVRLHKAVEVLRILARHFVSIELGISDCMYSGE